MCAGTRWNRVNHQNRSRILTSSTTLISLASASCRVTETPELSTGFLPHDLYRQLKRLVIPTSFKYIRNSHAVFIASPLAPSRVKFVWCPEYSPTWPYLSVLLLVESSTVESGYRSIPGNGTPVVRKRIRKLAMSILVGALFVILEVCFQRRDLADWPPLNSSILNDLFWRW